MGKNDKKKSNIIPAETYYLRLPPLADASLADQPIIDMHTHLVSTFSTYRSKYKNGTL
jgi:TatD DNase family protein